MFKCKYLAQRQVLSYSLACAPLFLHTGASNRSVSGSSNLDSCNLYLVHSKLWIWRRSFNLRLTIIFYTILNKMIILDSGGAEPVGNRARNCDINTFPLLDAVEFLVAFEPCLHEIQHSGSKTKLCFSQANFYGRWEKAKLSMRVVKYPSPSTTSPSPSPIAITFRDG